MEDITNLLMERRDETYRMFQSKLIPTVDPDSVIGVRTPALKDLAKALRNDPRAEEFLSELPHVYFDENQLHAFLLSDIKDFKACIQKVEAFLPFVDNWATCDQLSPKVFAKQKPELLECIRAWLSSDRTYTVRFGINMLMKHFLGADFAPDQLAAVAAITSDEYYINMGIAWYLATALAKQWDAVIPYLTGERLPLWVHNRTIQKAVESYRITEEQKAYLKTLRRK